MGYFRQIVLLYKKQDDGTFSDTAIEISDAYNFNISTGLADKMDVFSFNLVNSNNRYFSGTSTFEVGDNVKIYMWKNKANYDTDDLIIDGIIDVIDTIIIMENVYFFVFMFFTPLSYLSS